MVAGSMLSGTALALFVFGIVFISYALFSLRNKVRIVMMMMTMCAVWVFVESEYG